MKYRLCVRTDKNPLPRFCDFVVVYDSILAYHMKSLTIDLWIRKGTLKRIIDTGGIVTPGDCEIFIEREEKTV